jgi:predicted amidophosphoribosyltransferase
MEKVNGGYIMALINCYECNREISDLANSCPHCGAPAKSNKKNEVFIINSTIGKPIIAIGYTFILTSLIYLYGGVYKFFVGSLVIGIILVIVGKLRHWWYW